MEISPYRGLRADGKGWIHGLLSITSSGLYKITRYPKKEGDYNPFTMSIVNETLGEFLGIYDMNGEPIYDGDILDFDEEEWGGSFTPHPIHKKDMLGKWDLHGVVEDVKYHRKIVGTIYDEKEFD